MEVGIRYTTVFMSSVRFLHIYAEKPLAKCVKYNTSNWLGVSKAGMSKYNFILIKAKYYISWFRHEIGYWLQLQ